MDEVPNKNAEPPANKKKTPRQSKSSKKKMVKQAIEKFEQRLQQEDVKATFGDYFRLLQLQKDIDVDEPREIRVTWVDSKKESDSKK